MMLGFISVIFSSLLSCTAAKLTYTLSPCTLTTEQVQNLTVANSTVLPMTSCARLCSRTNGCGAFVTSPSCVLLQYPHHDPSSCSTNPGDTAFYQLYSEDPPCDIEIGVFGGTAFDFTPTYLASNSYLSRIRVFYSSPIHDSMYLAGIEVTYGASDVASYGSVSMAGVGDCVLSPGEYVNRVELGRTTWRNNIVIGSMAFVTNRQTCGPYGKPAITDSVEGTRLLYFKGRKGSKFDLFTFTFAACIP